VLGRVSKPVTDDLAHVLEISQAISMSVDHTSTQSAPEAMKAHPLQVDGLIVHLHSSHPPQALNNRFQPTSSVASRTLKVGGGIGA
jgi:hypothetical protein